MTLILYQNFNIKDLAISLSDRYLKSSVILFVEKCNINHRQKPWVVFIAKFPRLAVLHGVDVYYAKSLIYSRVGSTHQPHLSVTSKPHNHKSLYLLSASLAKSRTKFKVCSASKLLLSPFSRLHFQHII